jgi:hypothetical protein
MHMFFLQLLLQTGSLHTHFLEAQSLVERRNIMGLLNFKTAEVFIFVHVIFWACWDNCFISKTFWQNFNSFLCPFWTLRNFFIIQANSFQVFMKLALLLTFSGLQQCFKMVNTCSTCCLHLVKIKINFELNQTTAEFARQGTTTVLYWHQEWTERLDKSQYPAACLYKSQLDSSCVIRPRTENLLITFIAQHDTFKDALWGKPT